MQSNNVKHPTTLVQQMGRKHPDVSRSSPKPNTANPANGNQKLGTIVHRYCRLIEVKSHFENLEDANKIYQFEESFIEFSNRCKTDSDVEDLLLKQRSLHKIVSKASIFAFLANTPNVQQFLNYLCMASTIDEWQETLTSMNKIILDGFCCLKHSVRLKLVHLLEFIINKNPNNLDNVVINFFREFNSGNSIGSNEEVIEFLVVSLEMVIRNEWFQKYPTNGSVLFSCMFGTFSRLLSDLPPGNERCKQLLMHVVDFILRERFRDLLPLGRDLILMLQRLSKIMPHYWKNLIHSPQSLLPGFEGIPQLLSMKCVPSVMHRIAFRLQFCLDRILLNRPEIFYQFHCLWLTNDYLTGFDSMSLRSEIIRFVINNQRYQCATEQIKQCRNALLVHLILNSTKKNIVESQIAKLSLVFDFICSDLKDNNVVTLESFFMVFRYLIDKHYDIANSLLELVIRNTMELLPNFQTQIYLNVSNSFRIILSSFPTAAQYLIEHRNVDRNLRSVLSEFLPEIYKKQLPTNSEGNASTSATTRIEDLEAESRKILEQASSDHKTIVASKIKKFKARQSKPPDNEIENIRKGLMEEEAEKKSKSLDDLIPTLSGQLHEAVESFQKAVDNSATDDAIDPVDEARHLLGLIKELSNQLDKEVLKTLAMCILGICSRYLNEKNFYVDPNERSSSLNEQLNKPIYIIFECLYKSKNQKISDRRSWLGILKQMAKADQSIGYLLLFYLAANPVKNNKIETISYFEFADIMKCSVKEQINKDMIACAIECSVLFNFLVPFVFASFHDAFGSSSLIESICITYDEYQAYTLISQMHNRGDISLFRKDSFPEIFRTSLNWHHYAQNMFWHFIRVDSVSLDWIFDSLCLVNERKHPTVGLNLMNMIQIIDVDITVPIVRGLFCRANDNLTINLLNLIITDMEVQQQITQKLSSLMKTFLNKKSFNRGGSTKNKASEFSNLQTIFEHLERIQAIVPTKKGSYVQSLVKSEALISFYKSFKKNEEVFEEFQQNFASLFSMWQATENEEVVKSSRPGKGRKATSDARETKSKKPRVIYEELEQSDEEEFD